MTPKHDDQRMVQDELARALSKVQSADFESSDVVELLAFTGQARRLLAVVTWASLYDVLEHAESWVGAHAVEVAKAMDPLDAMAPFEDLEMALSDPDPTVSQLLDSLYDLDLIANALEVAGRDTGQLLEESRALVDCFPRTASLCAEEAAEFLARHGQVGGACPVWRAVAESAAVVRAESEAAPEPEPAWLAGMIEAHANRGVLYLPPKVVREPERLRAVANSATHLVPDKFPLWEADDRSWELVAQSAGDTLDLALSWRKVPPEWTVTLADGSPLPIQPHPPLEALVRLPVGATVTVTIAGQRRLLRPESDT